MLVWASHSCTGIEHNTTGFYKGYEMDYINQTTGLDAQYLSITIYLCSAHFLTCN